MGGISPVLLSGARDRRALEFSPLVQFPSKINPADTYNDGSYISPEDLDRCL